MVASLIIINRLNESMQVAYSYINCARNLGDLAGCRLKDGSLKDRTGAWKQGSDDSQLG